MGGHTQGSGGTTTPKEPSSGSTAKEDIKKRFDEIVNDFLNQMKKLFDQNVYNGSQQYMFNKVVKLTKGGNLWRLKLSDEAKRLFPKVKAKWESL